MPADRLRAGVAVLAKRYRVRVEPEVEARDGYLAGGDAYRAESFNRCLRDPDVRAVMVARGGYGTMRIVPDLDADALRRDPKVIVGFSDATALLCWALQCAGVRGIHGPMVAQLGELPRADAAWLFELLERRDSPPLPALDLTRIGAGQDRAEALSRDIEGPLLGGNLCLLSHLVGTPYQPDFTGSVLFFEEVNERPYQIDRYLTHLGLAGVLAAVAGVLVGDMADCPVVAGQPEAFAVIDERLRRHGVAGARGAPFAHGDRHLALPFAARCALRGTRLQLLEPAVA